MAEPRHATACLRRTARLHKAQVFVSPLAVGAASTNRVSELLLGAFGTNGFGATSQARFALRLRNTTTHLLALTTVKHTHDDFPSADESNRPGPARRTASLTQFRRDRQDLEVGCLPNGDCRIETNAPLVPSLPSPTWTFGREIEKAQRECRASKEGIPFRQQIAQPLETSSSALSRSRTSRR